MARKRKRKQRIYCYYCERDFKDEGTLLTHQRAKHFKCPVCHKKLQSVTSCVIHFDKVHKEVLKSVPGAMEGRTSVQVSVVGMQGIPGSEESGSSGTDAGNGVTDTGMVEPDVKRMRTEYQPPLLGMPNPMGGGMMPPAPMYGGGMGAGMGMGPPPMAPPQYGYGYGMNPQMGMPMGMPMHGGPMPMPMQGIPQQGMMGGYPGMMQGAGMQVNGNVQTQANTASSSSSSSGLGAGTINGNGSSSSISGGAGGESDTQSAAAGKDTMETEGSTQTQAQSQGMGSQTTNTTTTSSSSSSSAGAGVNTSIAEASKSTQDGVKKDGKVVVMDFDPEDEGLSMEELRAMISRYSFVDEEADDE